LFLATAAKKQRKCPGLSKPLSLSSQAVRTLFQTAWTKSSEFELLAKQPRQTHPDHGADIVFEGAQELPHRDLITCSRLENQRVKLRLVH
jgi:hypothetical protein